MDMTHLEIEPEQTDTAVAVVQALAEEVGTAGLATLLPDFPLAALLHFLPDVRLKRRALEHAQEALEVDVAAEGGLVLADARLAVVRQDIADIALCFDGTKGNPGPTALANMLHKRLTRLRADFTQQPEQAVAPVGARIYNEKKRRDDLAAAELRRAQEAADRKAREDLAAAAKAAKAEGAPAQTVAALKEAAKVATAPPVPSPAPAPALSYGSAVARYRVRFKGTAPGAEPHPDVKNLTPAQQAQLKTVLRAIADGTVPLAACAGLDWGYLDKRAAAEAKTLDLPELEVFDDGGLRGKPRGRR